MPTVQEVTFALMRKLDLTTVIGNPGSTEEPFLKNFPDDFTYVLALQESSVVGIGDGLAQALRKPVLLNLHTVAGMGNAMGCLSSAFLNKTPLVVTAGQQTRRMLLCEPFLTNVDAETLPRPWVKWSYEPKRPQDIPAALMRAYAMALQPPAGPVFLSLPLDDWDQEMDDQDVLRTVCRRVAPDPDRLADFAARIEQSRNPVLVYGGDVARAGAWDQGLALAEKLQVPVWTACFPERISFPQDHPLAAGPLPPAIGPLSQALQGHDLIVVVGAPVFRYYPWVEGDYLPKGAKLLQITDDPAEAGRAVVGDSLVGDAGLALEALARAVTRRTPAKGPARKPVAPAPAPDDAKPLTARQLFEALSRHTPEDYVLVNESPSNIGDLFQTRLGTVVKPDCYYMMASGGLGWGMPAAVGLALAERRTGRGRPVIAIIGDGSFQYSPQAIWSAAQNGAHVVYVVPRNEEYAILKSFAVLENTPGVPGLDLPGLDIVSIARGYGAKAHRAATADAAASLFGEALREKGVHLIEVPIDSTVGKLMGG